MKRLSSASGLLVLVVAATFGVAALAEEASVYKWVDSQGVPHFSDQPPPGSSAVELAIHYNKTDRAALQARLKAQSELTAASDVRESQESAANAAADADRKKVLAEREAICQAAKDRVAKYNNAQRLYKPGPNGERVYLTSEELDVERANASRAVEQSCSKN